MNAEQKQQIEQALRDWETDSSDMFSYEETCEVFAALLQELVDAPEVPPATNPSQISSSAEPFGYFKAEPFGWTDCAETDDGAIALYTAPPVSDVEPVAYVTGYNPPAKRAEGVRLSARLGGNNRKELRWQRK